MANLPDDPPAEQPRVTVSSPAALGRPLAHGQVPSIDAGELTAPVLLLLAELGVVEFDVRALNRYTCVGSRFGEEWASYWVEWTGFALDPDVAVPEPCPWPYYRIVNDRGREAVVQLWQRRIVCLGTGAYVDARWHPDRGESVALRGLESVTRLADAQRALKGLRLLRAIDQRGRKPGGTTWTEPEFREGADRARASFERRNGRKPFHTELAVEMGLTKPTYDRYKKRWPLVTNK